jgi:hypothetical protein
VKDTGQGFPPTPEFLLLGGTDKADDPGQKGKIGVGLKAVIFSSKRFTIHSVGAHGVWDVEVVNADEALEEASRNENTQVLVKQTLVDDPKDEAWGTTVTVDFRGRDIHDWLRGAVEAVFHVEEVEAVEDAARVLFEHGRPFDSQAQALLHLYFRSAPYTGDVKKLLLEVQAPTIHVRLNVGSAEAEFSTGELADIFVKPTYEESIPAMYLDYESLLNEVPRGKFKPQMMNKEMPPGGYLGEPVRDRIWILKMTTAEEFQALIRNRNGVITSGHEQTLGKINAIYLVMAAPEILRQVIPGGPKRVISSNGIITAHSFSTPRGARHELYVPRIHLIVDVMTDLNYGKRHLTDRWLVGHLQKLFSEAYSRTLFEATRGLSSDIRKPRDATDRSYVGLEELGLDLPFRKVPVVEQDVVGLFSALLGRGLLKDYQLFGFSQVQRYDGKFYARRARARRDPEFTTDDNLYNLEFKLRASQLCADFETDEKDPRDIHLAVVWQRDDCGPKWKVLDVDASSSKSDASDFPSVNYVLWDSVEGHEVQLLVLEELVASIKSARKS